MMAASAAGAMRTAFRTRTCARSPRAQSLYTVAVVTPSRRAAPRTVSIRSGSTLTVTSSGSEG